MKIKIIDLLNKIANGEEVPKKIRLGDNPDIFYYQKDINSYKSYNGEYLISEWLHNSKRLNVEIIGEEKKIPEKLNVISWDKCIHGVTHKEKELAIEINKTQVLLNQVLDYLKSKGE